MEIQGMYRRSIVIGKIAHVPILIKIGIAVITVVTDDHSLDVLDASGTQGIEYLVNDIGLARHENRAQGGITHAADDDITLEIAVIDHAIEVDRCLEAEVRSHQA